MTTALTHEQVLDTIILPQWRAAAPARMAARIDSFVERNRPALVGAVGVAWSRKLWADDLTHAQKVLAENLAVELSQGAPVESVLDAAIDLQVPGALDLATDIASLPEGDLKRRRAALASALARGARPKPRDASAEVDLSAADEARTPARRARKNIAAMELAYAIEESGEPNDEDTRTTLRGYSGWGGLSLEKYGPKFPEGWDPESPGLIHEYYTPSVVADAIAEVVCPMLEDVATPQGELRALEPSAGIGRFIDAFDRARCDDKPAITWTAVEFSDNSARLLGHIRPDIEVEHGTFESWVSRYGSALQGTIGLVVANPPYGERGTHAAEDPDAFYREKRASNYFLRRGLDLLAPNGIGVFLVPGGFLTGKNSATLRRKVLRRHHLSAAIRLPKQTFPGTGPMLDIDLLIFRSRGGELAEVDEADRSIVEGGYYKAFPNHDLSEAETFSGLPAFNERPQCIDCVVRGYTWKRLTSRPRARVVTSGESAFEKTLAEDLREALGLGARVRRYVAANSAGDPSALDLYSELVIDLEAIAKQARTVASIRTIAAQKDSINAEALAGVITPGGSVELAPPGPESTRYTGRPDDVVAQAEQLYADRRRLSLEELIAFHEARGGTLMPSAMVDLLFRSDWNLDGDDLDQVVPLADYVTGDLWPRVETLKEARSAAVAAKNTGISESAVREQLEKQLGRLQEVLSVAEFEDIQGVSPRQGWIPLKLVGEWLGDVAGDGRPLRVERRNGLVQALGVSYVKLENSLPADSVMAIGYLNHDFPYFQPKQDPPRSNLPLPPGSNAMETPLWTADASDPDSKITIDELRRRWGIFYESHFYAWALRDPQRKAAIEKSYNAAFRGFIPREYSGEPLDIARWGSEITLAPHQAAGARRVLNRRGGLIAFDVGVGKTFTAIAVVARARQEGWARRPVVLVPQSLVWKWKRDFTRCLPDFRVVVIGSEMHKLQGGKRLKAANKLLNAQQINEEEHEQMLMVSRTDTAADRGDKWVAFASGLFDVAIVSYEAFPQTRVREESLVRYAERTEAIMRTVELTVRNAAGKEPDRLTERQKAIKERGVRAWVEQMIASKREPDPRITWEDIGVDLLVVDEAASFKNLHMAEPREGGIPRYMGGGGRTGSKRAWNFDFRAGLVREATGGAGVVLLSATPAKNSPLEFYNMIQYIDGDAWSDRGITDPEQFIDRYTRIATQNVVTPSFEIEAKAAVVGFTQLDELRSIVFRYSEWRKAKDVGIELPRPRVCRCEVDLDRVQRAKYQAFVSMIEESLESGGKKGSILGYLARLGLVALHAQLDEGYTWKTALGGKATRQVSGGALSVWVGQGWQVVPPDPEKKSKRVDRGDKITITKDLPAPDPSSPKFRAIAQRVVAQPSCGHIIFCEPTAAHAWIRQVLIEYGIPAERIAVLNAEVAKAAARVKIARDFNGEDGEPKYDVVIANSVAYEGIDLQVRTCAIHHADLPWTPADLEQRNGRAHRQGNQFSTIMIYYYLGKGSMDLFRYDLIQGKSGWLEDLIAGNPETSNPAAQAELTPEDYLVALSADPEKTRRLIEQKRAGDSDKKRKAIITTANRLLQRASNLFAKAQRQPTEQAARSRAEGEELLDRLAKYAKVWPYHGLEAQARRAPIVLTAPDGVPIYEGLRLQRKGSRPNDDLVSHAFADALGMAGMGGTVSSDTGVPDIIEVGKPSSSDATTIAIREAGSAEWKRVHLADLNSVLDRSSFDITWTDNDREMMIKAARTLAQTEGMEALLVLHFDGASDAFRTAVWPVIRPGLMKNPSGLLPVERDGDLQLIEAVEEGDELLPWTPAGYERFLELALASALKVGELVTVARRWWGRSFPRALLKRDEAPAEEPVTAEPSAVTAAVRAAESAQLSELAQSPEGYALLLAQLGELAEIEDPLLIAPRFGDEWITDFTSAYTTQEAEGRWNTKPSEVWQTDEYLDEVLGRLRDHLLDGTAAVSEDPRRAGALRVFPDGIRGDASEGFYVLREDGAGSSAEENRAGVSRRYVELLDELSLDAETLVGVNNIAHPANAGAPLAVGDSVYIVGPDLDTETIEHMWTTYKELAESVRGAPTALERARKAMVYARVLVQAPRCQGEAKRSALEFLRGAFVYYRNAQERVTQGAAGAAYANLRRISRYLAREAVNLAESCAAGQLSLVTPAPIDVGNISDAAVDRSEEAEDRDYEALTAAAEAANDEVNDDEVEAP